MPRKARTVAVGFPHHITQRGVRKCDVFFTADDRIAYLKWLNEYSAKWGVQVLAYCLMTNHVHLILVPEFSDSLAQMIRPLHMRYAQRINRKYNLAGHLWQNRYFSSILDESYFWAAIRYVEMNPVRAEMVKFAEHYQWSSAAAHCGLKQDPVLTTDPQWNKITNSLAKHKWSNWLKEEASKEQSFIRKNTASGIPSGSDDFIIELERKFSRTLTLGKAGRPKKSGSVPN